MPKTKHWRLNETQAAAYRMRSRSPGVRDETGGADGAQRLVNLARATRQDVSVLDSSTRPEIRVFCGDQQGRRRPAKRRRIILTLGGGPRMLRALRHPRQMNHRCARPITANGSGAACGAGQLSNVLGFRHAPHDAGRRGKDVSRPRPPADGVQTAGAGECSNHGQCRLAGCR